MFCRMIEHQGEIPVDVPLHSEGRFVLHTHKDKQGAHLDLRIEQKGYLLGWRIDDTELRSELWGTEKLPHDPSWLNMENAEDEKHSGDYRWFSQGDGNGYLNLRLKDNQQYTYRVERWGGFSIRFQRALWQNMRKWQLSPSQVLSLIEDGITAREYAVRRMCGLGKFIEGDTFDASQWEKVMSKCSLNEIYTNLRKWENRLERQTPPQRLSQPEKVDETWAEKMNPQTNHDLLNLVRGQGKQKQ